MLHTDNLSKAKILNDQLSLRGHNQYSNIPHLHNPSYKDIIELHISQEGVEKLLWNVKASKASGPDRVPCRFLTELAPELAPILTKIFRQSLRDGVLPPDWTKAEVVPVFKKGAKDLAENYLPVSLTCGCCKILEHIISSHIQQHLEQQKILSKFQHGFRKLFSCETQLLVTLKGLLSYRNSLSTRVLSGVPQGTVLGPLLFLIHINDLPSFVHSQVCLYADNCLMYHPIYSVDDQSALQRDLSSLERWYMGHEVQR